METVLNMNPQTIEGLDDLVRINRDSAKGLQRAAAAVRDPELRSLFHDIAVDRLGFAERLAEFVALNGERATAETSVSGLFHRWWIDLRALLESGDAGAILAEVERGEDRIKASYEKVLTENPGTPLSELLHRQYAAVKRVHDRVRDMRDARRGS